jgi:hypothetical protein
MASGYPASVHGIGGWTTGAGRSFNAADVRVERVWDALSVEGRESVVVGWLMTWPAPAIEGALVSDRFVWTAPLTRDPDRPAPDEPTDATTFPESLKLRLAGAVPDDDWLAASPLAYQVREYGAPSHPLRRDEAHLRAFEALWPASHAAFGAVYLNGADQVSHLYWPFTDSEVQRTIRQDPGAHLRQVQEVRRRQPHRGLPPGGEEGLTAADLGNVGRWVPDYYRWLDDALDRVWTAVGPNATLILVSDHGFQVSQSRPLIDGQHRDVAVFAAVGPRVRAGARAEIDVADVAPTLYALLGVAPAADMEGQVLTELFDVDAPATVATRVLDRATIEAGSGPGEAGDAALRRQLEALGYIDEDGRPLTAIGESRRRLRPERPAAP